ncbi:MAG: hypothetical protein LBC95_03040 [Candidatus Nomurabacteria bacterium]|jgi:hypothetical protein|nr:hypothetical protein [Candidatus Nomurabacteria bacterium]
MTKISKIIAAASVLGIVGVAALPVAGYAASPDSKSVTVNVDVGSQFSLACALPDNDVTFTGGAGAADTSSMAGTCTVTSNNGAGYTLVAKSTQAGSGAANLIGTNSPSNIISSAAGIPTAGTAKWGINTMTAQTAPGTGAAAAWLAVPQASGAAISIASTNTVAGASGDTYNYTFGAAIAATTAADSYSDTVQFTATAK